MNSRCRIANTLAAALAAVGAVACRPSEPATVAEQRWTPHSTGCADATLLKIDADHCTWLRIDPENGIEEIIVRDSDYCESYDLSAHPTEARIMAHMVSSDGSKPEALREIVPEESLVRTVTAPVDLYVDYSGYDEDGRLSIILTDEVPEPSAPLKAIYRLLDRPDCALERARSMHFDGARWIQNEAAAAEACGDVAPVEELRTEKIPSVTMPGTKTLVALDRLEDKLILRRLRQAMAESDAAEMPTWREHVMPSGARVVIGGNDGYSFWIAFVDAAGRVVSGPKYEDGDKLRLRGRYLLSTSGETDSARLYDTASGAVLYEGDGYSPVFFWPCPIPR